MFDVIDARCNHEVQNKKYPKTCRRLKWPCRSVEPLSPLSPYTVFYLLFKIPRSVSMEIHLGKRNKAILSILPHSSKIDCLLATDKEMSLRVEREQGERKVGFQIRK